MGQERKHRKTGSRKLNFKESYFLVLANYLHGPRRDFEALVTVHSPLKSRNATMTSLFVKYSSGKIDVVQKEERKQG
jgi:hypothetical protein